jgi:ABC-2 type transport system permease protein
MMNTSLYQLTLMRLREFFREPEAVFWTFAFPLLLAGGLAVAFRAKAPDPIAVAVVANDSPRSRTALAALREPPRDSTEPLITVRSIPLDSVKALLQGSSVALIVVPDGDTVRLHFDPLRPDAPLARALVNERLQKAAGQQNPVPLRDRTVQEAGSRYIDFFIPGLLAMNLMGSSIFSLVFGIVQHRKQKLLKRLVATPMSRVEYLSSFVLARLVFLVAEVGILLAIGVGVLGVPLRGSLFTLLAVSTIGAASFGGIGLLISSRARTIEAASGLSNFIMLPMWILSGIFFSASRFPEAVQPVLRLLPLTALADALRAIMLQGASWPSLIAPVALLTGYGVVSLLVALKLFRWQ